MKVSEFDYDLPEQFIAQRPAEPRDASRLMVLDPAAGSVRHRYFRDLVDYLRPGDILVANDTRVIPARLFARKPTGGRVELLLLERAEDGAWRALAGGRNVDEGLTLTLLDRTGEPAAITATVPRGSGSGPSMAAPATGSITAAGSAAVTRARASSLSRVARTARSGCRECRVRRMSTTCSGVLPAP